MTKQKTNRLIGAEKMLAKMRAQHAERMRRWRANVKLKAKKSQTTEVEK